MDILIDFVLNKYCSDYKNKLNLISFIYLNYFQITIYIWLSLDFHKFSFRTHICYIPIHSTVLPKQHVSVFVAHTSLPVHYDRSPQGLFPDVGSSDVVPQSVKGPADEGWFWVKALSERSQALGRRFQQSSILRLPQGFCESSFTWVHGEIRETHSEKATEF